MMWRQLLKQQFVVSILRTIIIKQWVNDITASSHKLAINKFLALHCCGNKQNRRLITAFAARWKLNGLTGRMDQDQHHFNALKQVDL